MGTLFSPNNPSTQFHATDFFPHEPDLFLHTPRGKRIPVHATILASASPILENMVTSNRIVKINGVPYDAVTAFLRFLYTSRCSEEDMENYGLHLLVLSHVYSVIRLKQMCVVGLSQRATTDNVVDVLQLAKLCDAPDLYLKCVKLITNNFKAVEETEGWKFLQNNDPWLEFDILRFINEHKSRKKRAKRQREEQKLYVQLSEAMECLEHICTEGCTNVAPYDVKKQRKRPCSKFSTCEGLQVLIRHFATCKRNLKGGCLRCKRMWQLFRLHSSICLHQDSCKVPLCRQIQLKIIEKENKELGDARWKVLVSKVASAKAMSSLTLPKRKQDEEIGPYKTN
ncbi:BTB/POZ and TAZ domain-containing protein 1-like [Cicer arietinum]|uniref:BTB/POZ and TAZ domain-containing protein 1-like n=1 Tax=Cicer arietinum TaxID=3827 RepID=A0A1S2YBF5_CICAR|nr:BTB/POZ and TAZ domain-containing protein 1-like [Cicer arietinum]XP_027190088.1 BTB/POZ and TAZ domain-containing protein 1-like [Cicer arietinum]XP_027190089.1 BTB/POZ and TAZ domain-containing protein 1-like [Cicer arietinum]